MTTPDTFKVRGIEVRIPPNCQCFRLSTGAHKDQWLWIGPTCTVCEGDNDETYPYVVCLNHREPNFENDPTDYDWGIIADVARCAWEENADVLAEEMDKLDKEHYKRPFIDMKDSLKRLKVFEHAKETISREWQQARHEARQWAEVARKVRGKHGAT